MSKSKTDPRLELADWVKPDGTPIQINCFPASIDYAVDAGWMSKKEYDAKKATETKAAGKK